MAGSKSSKASRLRKRVEAESPPSPPTVKRARDGSAFAKCEECNKNVHVALIKFHDCTYDAKIRTNLEAQVVEMQNEPKKAVPAAKRKRTKQIEPKDKKESKTKTSKRKRAPTAFFLFMDDFRKSFKEANPGCKSVATVAKEGGEKWKSMSDEDKRVYVERAAELKAEFQQNVDTNDSENEDVVDIEETVEEEVTKDEAEEDTFGEEMIKNEPEEEEEE